MNSARMVWATPDGDALIAYMARVSNPAGQDNPETAARLIRYLIRNRHWSPFEMVNLCVEIETTRDIGRQLLRHRSLTFQEFSQRYQTVDRLPPAPLREARSQDPTNRQASGPIDPQSRVAARWRDAQLEVLNVAQHAYREALNAGIAKEVARAILPEGLTLTRMYANGTLRSWLHFLEVRRGHGTQTETVDLAEAIERIVEVTFPVTFEAWRTGT